MVLSENFHFKPFPNSRTKRERDRTQREREIAPKERSNPEPRALRLRTLRLCCLTERSNQTQIAPREIAGEPRALRFRRSTERLHRTERDRRWTQSLDHAFDFVEIAPQDRTEMAPIALRLQLRNGWVLMNLTGFDEFFLVGFCFCVYLLRNGIIYLFGSWENVRNKKKMCFLYYFQQHNQTLENIFQSIFWNATKHLKIFFFSKNSISGKYLFSGKYFTWTKHSLNMEGEMASSRSFLQILFRQVTVSFTSHHPKHGLTIPSPLLDVLSFFPSLA